MCVGYSKNKEEVIILRLKAEMKYFDERSWQKDLMIKYNLI